MASKTSIRLYELDRNGIFSIPREYGLEGFGGEVPSVGDRILEPSVASSLDQREFRNREILELQNPYFYQGAHDEDRAHFMLVVARRQATEAEAEAIVS